MQVKINMYCKSADFFTSASVYINIFLLSTQQQVALKANKYKFHGTELEKPLVSQLLKVSQYFMEHKSSYMHSSSPYLCYMSCPAHTPWFDLIIPGEEYRLWSASLCSFLQPSVTLSLFGPNIHLSYFEVGNPSKICLFFYTVLQCFCFFCVLQAH